MEKTSRRILRNFIIELLVYATLVVAYFLLVLQALGDWLTQLYSENLGVYAVAALLLIVAQGVLLEAVTSFLVERLGMERLE